MRCPTVVATLVATPSVAFIAVPIIAPVTILAIPSPAIGAVAIATNVVPYKPFRCEPRPLPLTVLPVVQSRSDLIAAHAPLRSPSVYARVATVIVIPTHAIVDAAFHSPSVCPFAAGRRLAAFRQRMCLIARVFERPYVSYHARHTRRMCGGSGRRNRTSRTDTFATVVLNYDCHNHCHHSSHACHHCPRRNTLSECTLAGIYIRSVHNTIRVPL